MLICTLNLLLLVAQTSESNFSLEGSGRGPFRSEDCDGTLKMCSHPSCRRCADSSTRVQLAAHLPSARLTQIWKHMQWLLLHGVFESGQHASVVGTNEKQVQNLFSVCVTLCGIFCSSANWSWEHMLCLFPLNTFFSQVPKYSSIPPLPALKQFTKPKIRKKKKELSWLAGNGSSTIMFLDVSSICYVVLAQKCANAMLSFWVFQILGSTLYKWKWMTLRFGVLIALLGPDPYSSCPCKLNKKGVLHDYSLA